MVCGPFGKPLEDALAACHQDVNLYHNALTRLAGSAGMGPYERAESVMVLFIAAGCSANVHASVTYALDYANTTCAGGTSTPLHVAVAGLSGADERAAATSSLGSPVWSPCSATSSLASPVRSLAVAASSACASLPASSSVGAYAYSDASGFSPSCWVTLSFSSMVPPGSWTFGNP